MADPTLSSWLVARSRLTLAESVAILVGEDYLSADFDTSFVDAQCRFDGLLVELQYNNGAFDASYGANGAWDDTFGWFRSPLKTSGGTHKTPWAVISELKTLYDADPVGWLEPYLGLARAEVMASLYLTESTDTTSGGIKAAAYNGVYVTSDTGELFDTGGTEVDWSGPTRGYVTADAADTTTVPVTGMTVADVSGRKVFYGPEEEERWPTISLQDDSGGSLRVTCGANEVDHYRVGDRILIINSAETGRTDAVVTTISSMDAANDRFVCVLAYADRHTTPTKVMNTFYAEWGVATLTTIAGGNATMQSGLTATPRKGQLVGTLGKMGGDNRAPADIALALNAMPAGYRVVRGVSTFSIPRNQSAGRKHRYGDRASWGALGPASYAKHWEILSQILDDTYADIKTECDLLGCTIDHFFFDWEGSAHSKFWDLDGAATKSQFDTAMQDESVGFDIAVDGYTTQSGGESPLVGTPLSIEAGKRRNWGVNAAMHHAMISYLDQCVAKLAEYFPDATFSNFRIGARLPWRAHPYKEYHPASAAGGLVPSGSFVNEGQAPMRIEVPAEGDGYVANLETMEFYLPAGADGTDDQLRWLQMEQLCNRLQEMTLANRRGLMMWFYEKQDSQNNWMQNHALYEDAVLLCLVHQTLNTVSYLNNGQSGTGDDDFQAAMVEFNEMIPYSTRAPISLDPVYNSQLYGNAIVRGACAAASYIFWYVIPDPAATVSISESGGRVTVSTTSPYTDTWIIDSATILTPTAATGSGTWIRQTPPQQTDDIYVDTGDARRVKMASGRDASISLRAASGNTGKVYVGGSGTTIDNGFELSAGDSIVLPLDAATRVTDIYVASDTSGQRMRVKRSS